MFQDVIWSEAELRELYRPAPAPVQSKILDQLEAHARTFIATSPFVLIGTKAADGTADVSPKGGPPGFVVVLDDHHLAIPDLSGNNLLDSITNVVLGSGVGLLFVIPGMEETLRVNGHACITTDADVLDACAVKDRRPKVAIGVTVVEQFMHCAKAFRRSELWEPSSWPDRSSLPTPRLHPARPDPGRGGPRPRDDRRQPRSRLRGVALATRGLESRAPLSGSQEAHPGVIASLSAFATNVSRRLSAPSPPVAVIEPMARTKPPPAVS